MDAWMSGYWFRVERRFEIPAADLARRLPSAAGSRVRVFDEWIDAACQTAVAMALGTRRIKQSNIASWLGNWNGRGGGRPGFAHEMEQMYLRI